jgi:shikimate 5-dehydrogenase
VETDDLSNVKEVLEREDFGGASVTIPFKKNVT